MKAIDNAKVIEALEKLTVFNYFEKLLRANFKKIELFSVMPITAAPNLSDPHPVVLIEDLVLFTSLNRGKFNN